MIQANELRIKNLVYDKDNNVREICGIQYPYTHLTSLRSPVLAQSVQFNEIEPINLTEDILLMAGFEKATGKRGDYFFHKVFNGFRLWIDNITPNYNVGRKSDAKTYWVAGGIKSLHQLQNIFYALTGKELEVNL